jgi:hypothetical protein
MRYYSHLHSKMIELNALVWSFALLLCVLKFLTLGVDPRVPEIVPCALWRPS